MNKKPPTMTAADGKIKKCIDNRESFLLDAGAGSGKTRSLVTALNYIRNELGSELTETSQKVACITFTNVAKSEIIERTECNPLFAVFTIHDFLWSVLKTFQNDLKQALLAHNSKLPVRGKHREEPTELRKAMDICKRIHYSDRGINYLEGRISHDDLLEIALIMFKPDTKPHTKPHTLLSRVISARYPFIFVDEYQDTSKKVIFILLNYILKYGMPATVGLFGDKWQSIYSNGIGEIPIKWQENLKPIQKTENYRCSMAVIKLLNQIRTDVEQKAAHENVPGSAVYINLNGIKDTAHAVDRATEIVKQKFNWPNDGGDTKTLFLTHKLIARQAKYEELWVAYRNLGGVYQDRFQSGEDEIARFLCKKVESLIDAWSNNKIGLALSVLNPTDGTWANAKKKARIKKSLDELVELSYTEVTIGNVLTHIRNAALIPLPDNLEFLMEHLAKKDVQINPEMIKEWDFFKELIEVPYQQVRLYRDALEDYFPYSTKHGVKGDEFETVFVVLDDTGTNGSYYSLGRFLTGTDTSDARLIRTRNLFYVCCSRSKNRLAVIDLDDATGKQDAIERIFGADACVMQKC